MATRPGRPRSKETAAIGTVRNPASTSKPILPQKSPAGVTSSTKEPQHLSTITQAFTNFKADLTCKICVRYLYEPFTAQCGHTFCYSCLSQWFNGNSTGRKKTCPECRAVVDHAPAPAYLVRDLVHKVLEQPLFCDEGETVEQHNEWRQEEARIVEKDRSNTHPQTGGLFHGRFKPKGLPSHLRLVRDDEDGVDRCPNCTWEIEDGEDACQHCGFPVDDDGSTDYDDEMTIDSMLRDELDEDMSLDDVELDLDMQLGAMVHPMNSMTRIQGRNSYPARTPDQIVDLVSESDSQSSTAEGRSISLGSRSGSDEDEDEDDDEPDEVDDTLMEGFVDDDPEGSDESEESEAPESSPRPAPSRARDKGARRGNPYIVESSEEESSDDEGGAVTRQPARRSATFRLMNRMFNNSPSTTGDDSSSED